MPRQLQVMTLFAPNDRLPTLLQPFAVCVCPGIAQRLASCGIPCDPEDIITPALCAALYLKQHNIGTRCVTVIEVVP